MLSTTSSSISNSNSIISDCSSFRDLRTRKNQHQQQQQYKHSELSRSQQQEKIFSRNLESSSSQFSGGGNFSNQNDSNLTSSDGFSGYADRYRKTSDRQLNNYHHGGSKMNQRNNALRKMNSKSLDSKLNINSSRNMNNNVNVNAKRYYNKHRNSNMLVESSELSSNNLTISELESSNSQIFQGAKVQRRRLIKCVLKEDLDMMKVLLGQADLENIRDRHKNTLMHIACGFGRLKAVQYLMKLCPTLIDQVDDKGHNPLDIAIKHGQFDVIKWLLNRTNRLALDSQPQKLNIYHRSCLHFAAKHGECEILRYILSEMYKQQLLLDIQDINGNTAAHLAAKYNHLDCLQALVEFNCDVTIVNKNGHTPCFVAEYYGNQECVHYLMIVETCINLSIKVVKIGRKLRETKTNNEILKAQMDEAIAINNDFINQRENVMNISLDLMQRQINELENKVFNEIKRLEHENNCLKEKINLLNSEKKVSLDKVYPLSTNEGSNSKKLNLADNQSYQQQISIASSQSSNLSKNNYLFRNKSMNSINNIGVSNASNDVASFNNNPIYSKQNFHDDLDLCKQELANTSKNCNKVLKMDQKKLDSVKSRFNEIKKSMEACDSRCSVANCDNTEIFQTKEHLDVLKKMYQDATHKLMIFRNALKERHMNKSKGENDLFQRSSSSSSSPSSSVNGYYNSNSGSSNNGLLNNYSNSSSANKMKSFTNIRNFNDLNQLDEINEEDEEYFMKESASKKPPIDNRKALDVSSSPSSNNQASSDQFNAPKSGRTSQNSMSKLNKILTNEQQAISNQQEQQPAGNEYYDCSSDDTLSDNDSNFADLPGEEELGEIEEEIDCIDNNNNNNGNNNNNNRKLFYENKNYYLEDLEEEDESDVSNKANKQNSYYNNQESKVNDDEIKLLDENNDSEPQSTQTVIENIYIKKEPLGNFNTQLKNNSNNMINENMVPISINKMPSKSHSNINYKMNDNIIIERIQNEKIEIKKQCFEEFSEEFQEITNERVLKNSNKIITTNNNHQKTYNRYENSIIK